MTFYHFTCAHARAAIGGHHGTLLPLRDLVDESKFSDWPAWRRPILDIVWLTDMADPDRRALGLTSRVIGCDRTEHRYRVFGYNPMRYVAVRRDLPKRLRDDLESASGVLPMHWWLAYTPVPVLYDPIMEAVA